MPDQIARQRARVKHFGDVARKAKAKLERIQKRIRWAVAKRTIHRKKLKAAKGQKVPQFEPYMLNGCPGNVTIQVKREIAWAVVKHSAYVTATTNGTHVATSFHYPSNNRAHGYSDLLGHAVDFGGPYSAYGGYYADRKSHPGCSQFDELFGPGSGYCKSCGYVAGAAPDNPNHTHSAPKAKR